MDAWTAPVEAEGLREVVLAQLPAIAWATDAGLRFTALSGRPLAAIGVRPDEVVGRTVRNVFAGDKPDSALAAHQHALAGEATSYPQTWRGRRLEARVEPLCDPDGRVVGTVGVAVDVTDRTWTPATLFGSEADPEGVEELQRAWEREREVSEHLRRLDELKILLLHAVSHDLRGPITAILGSALVLEDGDRALDDEKRADLVQGIAASARKLNRLLTDLLDLDRLERGIVEPDRRPTDVGALARRVVAELGLPRDVEVRATRGQADVDPVHVERIIENLLLNADKHTPLGTPVCVEVTRHADGIEIDVSDTGPGVPPELREAIFEPFRQGDGGQGLGIGLSLVARFAALHGGRAWVEDAEGGGARFRVTLPRAGLTHP